jgi:hypothetical protein
MAIPLASNFNVNVSLPIDSRTVVDSDFALNSIPNQYIGLIAFSNESRNLFYLKNINNWVALGTGFNGSNSNENNIFYANSGIYFSGLRVTFDKSTEVIFEGSPYINKINNNTTFGVYNYYNLNFNDSIEPYTSGLPLGIRTGDIVNLFYKNSESGSDIYFQPSIMTCLNEGFNDSSIIPIINHPYYQNMGLKKIKSIHDLNFPYKEKYVDYRFTGDSSSLILDLRSEIINNSVYNLSFDVYENSSDYNIYLPHPTGTLSSSKILFNINDINNINGLDSENFESIINNTTIQFFAYQYTGNNEYNKNLTNIYFKNSIFAGGTYEFVFEEKSWKLRSTYPETPYDHSHEIFEINSLSENLSRIDYSEGIEKIYLEQASLFSSFTSSGNNNLFFGNKIVNNSDGSVIAIAESGRSRVSIYTGIQPSEWVLKSVLSGDNLLKEFGSDININYDGSIIFVASKLTGNNDGRVSIYKGSPSIGWSFNQILENQFSSTSEFGKSITSSYDGSKLFIGAPGENNQTGAVLIFTGDYNNQYQYKNSIINNSGAYFGKKLSTDYLGNILFVGSNNNQHGAVYIYTGENNIFDLEQKIENNITLTIDNLTQSLPANSYISYASTFYTGWVPNNYYINTIPGSFIEITVSGAGGGYFAEWRAKKTEPSIFSSPSDFGNNFTLLSNNKETGRLTIQGFNSVQKASGYLPDDCYYLTFLGTVGGAGNIFLSASYPTGNSQNFGNSISNSTEGNILFIGAPNFKTEINNNVGRISIYSGSTDDKWTLVQNINGTSGQMLGADIDNNDDGSNLFVGARGIAGGVLYYTGYNFDQWGLGYSILNSSNLSFGSSISTDEEGTLLLVGSPLMISSSGTGIVYAYTNFGKTILNSLNFNIPITISGNKIYKDKWNEIFYENQFAGNTAGFAGRSSNGSLTLYAGNQSTAVPTFYGWDGFQNTSFGSATARTNLGLTSTATQTENTFVRTTGDQIISGSKTFSASHYIFSGANVTFTNNTGIVSGEWQFSNRPTVNGTGVFMSGEVIPFDGNRPIKRAIINNVNPGGQDVVTFLNNLFYPFISGTVLLNNFNILTYGVNSATQLPFAGSITLNDNTITGISFLKNNDILNGPSSQQNGGNYSTLVNFGENLTASTAEVYKTRVYVQTDGAPTIIDSSLRRIRFEPLYYFGVSNNSNLGSNITTLTSSVPANYTYSYGGKPLFVTGYFEPNNQYVYFAYPSPTSTQDGIINWGNSLASIIDLNTSFNYTTSYQNLGTVNINFPTTSKNLLYRIYRSNDLLSVNVGENFNLQFTFGT